MVHYNLVFSTDATNRDRGRRAENVGGNEVATWIEKRQQDFWCVRICHRIHVGDLLVSLERTKISFYEICLGRGDIEIQVSRSFPSV